eukprot:TRINITY_DN39231_c0_g1_i1.p1 TRINITY_DN39231_c0_g1~~TRINITY_DN39231_c0_g1_i1.p1  ORF type:complete len:502 (-),score=111.40 TRINITY_DN39231_c0_g1_i1:165-1610(-)
MEPASSAIRYVPLHPSANASTSVAAADSAGDVAELPCFPLHDADNARIVPHSKRIVLTITETQHVNLVRHVQESRAKMQDATGWSCGRFLATRAVRDAEPPASAVASDDVELRRGRLVKLHGLRRADLNGSIGILLHFCGLRRRWEVDLEDRAGVKALKPENLEPVPVDTPHKAFAAWRSARDVGGAWRLAEFGVLLRLEKSEEMRTAAGAVALRCTLSAEGVGRLRSVANPNAFAERSAVLMASVERVAADARAAETPAAAQVQRDAEAAVLRALRELLELQGSSDSSVSIVPDKGEIDRLSAQSDREFWKLVGFLEALLQAQLRGKSLKSSMDSLMKRLGQNMPLEQQLELMGRMVDMLQRNSKVDENGQRVVAVDMNDLPTSVLDEIRKMRPPELTFFDRKRLDETLPLQRLLQSESHEQRLHILLSALAAEKQRLTQVEISDEEVTLAGVLGQSVVLTGQEGHPVETPFVEKRRSRL